MSIQSRTGSDPYSFGTDMLYRPRQKRSTNNDSTQDGDS
jgi:hypothetical protein